MSDVLNQQETLKEHIIELQTHAEKAKKREESLKKKLASTQHDQPHEVNISDDEDDDWSTLGMVSFEDTLDEQIKSFTDHAARLYEILENVQMDPDTLCFSLNDAMYESFMAEPGMDSKAARQKAKKAIRNFTEKKRTVASRSSEEALSPATKIPNNRRRDGTFMPYVKLCTELLRRKELTVFPRSIIFISAHVLAPSAMVVLSLTRRIRQIAEGKVNMVLLGSILGSKGTEFSAYLQQLKQWNRRNQLCQEKISQQEKRDYICGKRVNFGKAMCSYHMTRKKRKIT